MNRLNRKHIYSIIAVALVTAIYGYEHYLKIQDKELIVTAGTEIKENTNAYYLPTSTTGQVVHHKGYSLSYNEPHEQAEWVAYELKKADLSKSHFKRPYFEIDEAVATGAAHWRNYKNSGYDRGHLCPAADRQYNKEVFNETFLTSNITPQDHDFNSGIWNQLEQQVRYWAKIYDGVYVVTGGVLKDHLKSIGSESVSVPEYFYKVIFDRTEGAKMIAFLIPHETSNKSLKKYVVSVDAIEELTGIDFFPNLKDSLENKLEARINYQNWRFVN